MKPSLLAILLLFACAHPQGAVDQDTDSTKATDAVTVQPRSPEDEVVLDNTVWAEPIAPEMTRTYPHLVPHIGQLILGDDTVQFVLGGMGTLAASDHLLLSAAFVRTPFGWERQAGSGPVTLRFAPGKGSPRLVGMNPDVSSDAATWQFNFKSAEASWSLEARFDRVTRILMWRFSPEGPAQWRLRWDMSATDLTWLADNPNQQAGAAGGFIARGGSHPVAFQAFSPFEYQALGEVVELASARAPKADAAGFLMFAGPATAHLAWSLDAQKTCRAPAPKEKPSAGEFSQRFFACWSDAPRALLFITADAETGQTGALRRQLTMAVDQQPALPFALHPRTRLTARVPAGKKVAILERRRGQDHRAAEMTLTETQTGQLTLAPRGIGRAIIHLRSKETRIDQPVFLTVSTPSHPRREALTPLFTDDSAQAVSPWHAWVSRWPHTFALPEGTYDFELSHRMLGKPCQLKIEVAANEEKEWTCNFEDSPKPGQESLAVSADFVQPWSAVREQANAHFGLVLYRVANPQNLEPGGVFALEVEDPAQGYSAQVISPSEALYMEFESPDERSRPQAVEVLAREFRKTGNNGLFVLGCPPPSVSAAEYARLVKKIRPDAVRVIGCGTSERERELMSAAALPYDGENAPILLPAATFSVAAPHETPLFSYFPREGFPLTPRPLTSADWVPLMREGRYGWGRAATLLIKPQEQGKLFVRNAEAASVRFTAWAGNTKDLRFTVLSEKGVVYERPILPEELANLGADFPLGAEIRWLRAELRAVNPNKTDEELVLAGTGWIKLAPPPKTKG